MTRIKLGADPEVFIQDSLGYFVAPGEFLPGTKDKPFEVECGAVQVDGLAFEFNIHPAETEEEFSKNIETVMAQMKEMVEEHDSGFKLVCSPIAKFDPEYFKLVDFESKILGCSPDYNYLGEQNTPPTSLRDKPLRTAGAHLHIGWTEGKEVDDLKHLGDCIHISRTTHISGMFKPETKEEILRLKLYGGNGAFRPKSYGIELREPSNLWIKTPKSQKAMFRKMKNLMESII